MCDVTSYSTYTDWAKSCTLLDKLHLVISDISDLNDDSHSLPVLLS